MMLRLMQVRYKEEEQIVVKSTSTISEVYAILRREADTAISMARALAADTVRDRPYPVVAVAR